MLETRFNPWVGKIPWKRKWQSTPVFLPGEFYGQRILAGYSSWGRKKLDMTERISLLPTVISLNNLLKKIQIFLINIFSVQFGHSVVWSRSTSGLPVHPHLSEFTATAAKSFQSCLSLCDPIDSSPTGSPVPGILQARTLEWVAISFSNAWKRKVKVKSLSHIWLLATPWTAAYQAPPSMGFSRQEYWSGVPLPSLTTKNKI